MLFNSKSYIYIYIYICSGSKLGKWIQQYREKLKNKVIQRKEFDVKESRR